MTVKRRCPGRTRTTTHYWRWSQWYGGYEGVRVEGWTPIGADVRALNETVKGNTRA